MALRQHPWPLGTSCLLQLSPCGVGDENHRPHTLCSLRVRALPSMPHGHLMPTPQQACEGCMITYPHFTDEKLRLGEVKQHHKTLPLSLRAEVAGFKPSSFGNKKLPHLSTEIRSLLHLSRVFFSYPHKAALCDVVLGPTSQPLRVLWGQLCPPGFTPCTGRGLSKLPFCFGCLSRPLQIRPPPEHLHLSGHQGPHAQRASLRKPQEFPFLFLLPGPHCCGRHHVGPVNGA